MVFAPPSPLGVVLAKFPCWLGAPLPLWKPTEPSMLTLSIQKVDIIEGPGRKWLRHVRGRTHPTCSCN